MNTLKILRYEKTHHKIWDEFIRQSKNGIFLFLRDYMEYHSDRFRDFSLLFFEEDRLIAVMPANVVENTLVSHGGLTFGGIISDAGMKASKMLGIFEALKQYLPIREIDKVIYKSIPHIYHTVPAEEDLYALSLNGANLVRRDVSSTILQSKQLAFSKGRKSCIKKAEKLGIEVKRSYEFSEFMAIEESHLIHKHSKKPVHSAEEISYLANFFPDNIKLFAAYQDITMLGGVIIYESSQVAHAQYIAATDKGKDFSALDAIINYLINSYYIDKKYFDFGISTRDQGRYLDMNLIANKESFGARAVVYDFYEVNLR